MTERTTQRLAGAQTTDDLDEARALAEARRRLLGRGQPLSLSRYTLGPPLGKGGGGTVYRAHDPTLRRDVAIKVVRAVDGAEPAAVAIARLRREARVLAALSHPNIIPIFDVGTLPDDDGLFVVMDLVDGGDLAGWLETKPPWTEVLDRMLAAGEGLAAAHDAGVIHRDFKPANVLCDDQGRVLVADFGLARAPTERPPATEPGPQPADLAEQVTMGGTVVGTPSYMAPEQHFAGSIDARTDQFAFCAALYEGLFGVPAFEGDTIEQLAHAKVEGPRPPPTSTSIPPHLRAIVDRGLASDPEQRFADMRALLRALRARPRSWRRRVGPWAGAAGLAIVLASALRPDDPEPAPDPCAQRAEAVAPSWSEDGREQIGRAFAATGVAFAASSWSRSAATIDAYVERLREQTQQACQAAAPAQRACLTAAAAALEQILEAWHDADVQTVERAAMTVARLPRLDVCRSPDQDAWPPDLARLRGQQEALISLGDTDAALAIIEQGLADPSATLPVIELELRRIRGRLLADGPRRQEGQQELDAVFLRATELSLDSIAADTATDLIVAAGSWGGDPEQGLEWGRHALALAERLDDDWRRGRALDNLGEVLAQVGRNEEALEHHQRARALLAEIHGEDSLTIAIADNRIGNANRNMGHLDEAEAAYRRAMAGFALEGEDHPLVARVMSNLANIMLDRDEPRRALETMQQVVECLERAYPSGHHSLATALNGLANAHWETGDHEAAMPHYERALALYQQTLGPEHVDTAFLAFNIGNRQAEQGDVELARRSYQLATDVFRRQPGLEPHLVNTLIMWGQMERDGAKRPETAWELLVEAETRMLAKPDRSPSDLATVHLMLASLDVTLERPAEARRRADAAIALLADGANPALLAQAEEWLGEHPP